MLSKSRYYLGTEAANALEMLFVFGTAGKPEGDDQVVHGELFLHFSDRCNTLVRRTHDKSVDTVPREDEILLPLDVRQSRLQLSDKSGHFLEIHPVVRPDDGPPGLLYFFEGICDPSIA